jgi:hypothetical protein
MSDMNSRRRMPDTGLPPDSRSAASSTYHRLPRRSLA